MGDVMRLPPGARRQMRQDAERIKAYNARLAFVQRLFWFHWWGR
jgi:hypothetical protein